MEVLSLVSIAAGVLGILASALATWLSAARKAHLTIRVAGMAITIKIDKEISPTDIEKIESVLRDLERDKVSTAPAADGNGKS